MKDSIPLPEGSTLGADVIQGVAERGRFGYSYLAAEGASQVLIREFLPHGLAWRDQGMVQARDPEDRNALRWWIRSFLEQGAALQKLAGPGLMRVLRSFEANGTAYQVCERPAGESLAAILERQGSLAEAQLRRMLQPLLAGLERAHAAGFLHRDIRPQNILVGADDRAVLGGFSMLRAPVRFKGQTMFSAAEPPYAAPEELAATAATGPWTDIYALGAVLYEAVAGIKLADARSRAGGAALPPAAQMAQQRCSEEFLAAIDAALVLPAAQRPQSLAAWRGLAQPQGGSALPSLVLAAPAADEAVPPPRRKSLSPLLLALVLVAAVAGGAWFLMHPAAPGAGSAPAATPLPAVAPAAPATPAAAPSAPAASSGGGLDAMMVELMAKEKKLDDLRNQQQVLQSQRPQAPVPAPRPMTAETQASAPSPATSAAAPGPSQAELNAEARARQLEAEIEKLKADKEAAQKPEDDGGRAPSAQESAQARAKVEQDREAKIIAKAKSSCRIPAPTLSTAGNLTYDRALLVPGAEKRGNAVLLPPVTMADGSTASFEITPDSCARLIGGE